MGLRVFISILAFVVTIESVKRSYANYKVYNVIPNSREEVQILLDLQKQDGIDFWKDVFSEGDDVRIMVSPESDIEFLEYIKEVGLNADLRISNVQELIDAQLIPAENTGRSSGLFNWNRYHDLGEIHAWLDELGRLYPDIVTVVVMGQSNEGRDIKGVKIDFKPNERGNSPLIGMLEGGIHAREWISPATLTWIINEFLTSTDRDVRFMAETFVWHIFPVTNPDGYSYTFSDDRMWRKNRNDVNFTSTCGANNDLSNGIDLNRNFDFLWMGPGASNNPCAQTFAGPSAGSEPETAAISEYVLELKNQGSVIYYFAFHSYSQMILVPYSHVSGYEIHEVGNYGDLYEIAIRGADKLSSRYGTQYTVGTSAEILYIVTGSSFDWVKGVAEIPIVYLFELRDILDYGFLLPPNQIIPNNEEIMDCLLEMDRVTRNLGYYSNKSYAIVNNSILLITLAIASLVYS